MDNPECQALLTDFHSNISFIDGILYKINNNDLKLPLIPKSLRNSILTYFHDSPQSGHLGYRKTIQRMLRRVYWFGMHEDIYTYVVSCHKCQINKNPRTLPSGQLQSQVTQGPWDTLAIDFMGPLPITKRRNTMLLVVVDHFSKWVELFAMPDSKAERVSQILEKEIFCRWGSPKFLISDNATKFNGSNMRKLCTHWNISHKFLTTYQPQSNIAERINSSIRAILSSYIGENHAKWDDYLHTTALALRTAISDTTGFSPAMLNLGRDLLLPFDRAFQPNTCSFNSRSEYQSQLISKLQAAYTKANLSITKAQAQQAKYYNARHKAVTFQVGESVLLKSHYLSDKKKKFSKKFAVRWTGPFKIVRVCSPVTYELDIPNSDFLVHNVKNLKIYHDRPNDSDTFLTNSNEQSFDQVVIPHDISHSNDSQLDSLPTHSYNLRSKAKS